MNASRRFKFAVNSYGRDKDWNWETLATRYQDSEGTIQDVIHHVSSGHALCAGLLGGQRRSKANVIGSEWLLLDIDNSTTVKDENGKPVLGDDGKAIKIYSHQLTLHEAIANPFVQQYCSLIYTTASHRHDWHKFRLIFLLPEYIEGTEAVESMVRLLMEQFPHDPSCKDASRVFFGSTQATFPLVNPDACLPADWLNRAIALAEEEKAARQAQLAELAAKREQFRQVADEEEWDTDELIRQALSFIPPRAPGSGNYDECRQVLMALVDHYGPIEGQEIAESWSPSIPGNTWNIAQKVRSFRRSGITIGTLFKIAQGHGFKFPERRKSEWKDTREPDSGLYQSYLEVEQDRLEVERVQAEYSIVDNLKQWLAKHTRKQQPARGFAPIQKERKAGNFYQPGNLPVQGQGQQTEPIKYRPGQLSQLVIEAREKGWKNALDTSQTGAGKSHQWMSLAPTEVGIFQDEDEGRAIYWGFDRNHRNSTTLPGEKNFVDMPVRHNGFVQDHTRRTPMGNPHLRHPKKDEQPDTKGNCELTSWFHLASDKRYEPASEASAENPICRACRHFAYCGQSSGDGWGFRSEKRDAFKKGGQLRSAIESAPSPEHHDYSRDVGVFDEAMQQLQPVTAISVDVDGYNHQWNEVEDVLPDQFDFLATPRRKLRELVAGGAGTYDNGENEKIRELLGDVPDGLDIDLIYSELTPDISNSVSELENLEELDETGEAIAKLKGKLQRREAKLVKLQAELKELEASHKQFAVAANQIRLRGKTLLEDDPKEAKKKLERFNNLQQEIPALAAEIEALRVELERVQTTHSMVKGRNDRKRSAVKNSLKDAIERLSVQWLVPFLEVWTGRERGAVRVGPKGGLTITIGNYRQSEIINSLGFAAFLDATATPQLLSLHSGVPLNQILWIEMDTPETDNLTGIQVSGFGQAGKGRVKATDDRLTTFINWAKQKHGTVAVFDHYDKREVTGANGWHFGNDVRGSNRFQDCSAIVIIGLPQPNVGVLKDRWLALGGEATGMSFDDYYQSFVDAELVQEVGRLRANRRPDEDLTVYLIAESEKYTPPADIFSQYVDVADICPDAADSTTQAWKAVQEMVKRWFTANGEIPTQTEISEETGFSQGWISKLIAQFAGGWKAFKKLFHSLLVPSYRNWNNSNQAPPEPDNPEDWVAAEYLPEVVKLPSLEVAEALNGLVDAFGWGGWHRILKQVPRILCLNLIAAMFRSGWVEAIA